MEGRDEPQNLYDFAAVSRGISWAGPRNLAKFSAENCGPYWSLQSMSTQCHLADTPIETCLISTMCRLLISGRSVLENLTNSVRVIILFPTSNPASIYWMQTDICIAVVGCKKQYGNCRQDLCRTHCNDVSRNFTICCTASDYRNNSFSDYSSDCRNDNYRLF